MNTKHGLRLSGCALLVAAQLLGAPSVARREITIRPEVPLLMVDDQSLLEKQGVFRTVHPARTRSAPVLQADRPWEGDRVYTYGSVLPDPHGGGFQLWYMSRSQGPGPKGAPQLRAGGQDLVLYATSSDGLVWQKPLLDLHAYHGSKANNIVLDLHSPSVVRDRFEKDPARQLKMLGHFRGKNFSAHSADGIHWTEDSKEPAFEGDDTMTMTQDPLNGEFLVFFKKGGASVPGRVVWLTRSRDLRTWSEPVLVFHPDAEDNRWASNPNQRMEVYSMSVVPHAGGFVGFPMMFRVMSRSPKDTKMPIGQSPHDGPIDVQMVTSTDAEKWERSYPRVHVIPRGLPGTFDGGAILGVSSGAVHAGDSTWMLYTAINTGHGGTIPPKRLTIGRADWRLHGFASIDAGPMGGRIETRPLRVEGGTLVVNADASRGRLRAALLEQDGSTIPGFGLDDVEALRADATRHHVRWKGAQRVPEDRLLRVVIEMTSARLYSLAASSTAAR